MYPGSSITDSNRNIEQIIVDIAFKTICHIAKKGKVIKISIKTTPINKNIKTARLVAFFLTNFVGVFNIKQSKAPEGLNILRTSR